jgi:hypothetical protein
MCVSAPDEPSQSREQGGSQHGNALPDLLTKADDIPASIARLAKRTAEAGTHLIELQGDEDRRLWLMLHSGSRGRT